jgi:hypothetical protein
VLLAGEVFELGDARIGVIIGIIDDGRILEARLIMRLVLESKRAIRKRAEAIVENSSIGPV